MKKISMMVIALLAVVTMSATVVQFDFTVAANLSGWGITLPETGKGTNLSGTPFSQDGVTFTCVKNNSNNDTKIWNNKGSYDLRTYNTNTITLTAGEKDTIYGVVLSGTQLYLGQDAANQIKGNGTNALTMTAASGTTRINTIKVYVNENLPSSDLDTISVSEARDRIDKGNKDVVCVKGVVATAPVDPGDFGNTIFWMTDIENPSDSLKGYKIFDVNGAKFNTISDIPFGLGDTIIIKATGLKLFGTTIYETDGGSYVRTVGTSSAINANDIYKYAIGAVYKDTVNGKYTYDIAISPEGTEAYENALHMVIRSANAKGIAGSYTLYATGSDSSYVDGAGAVSGSVQITYVSEGAPANAYKVEADFKVGDKLYRMDTTYNLAGWLTDFSDQYKLVDDVPFQPQDGDTITCAQAASYASTLTPDQESSPVVYVRGFATGFPKITGRSQQSVFMADDASSTKGVFEGYLCYTQNLDSIIKGDEILVKGKIQYSSKGAIAEISKGKIYRIGGSQTGRPRNPQAEAEPAGAITVEQALAIGNALQAAVGKTVYTDETYTVVGYIVDVNRQVDNDSATWYMADVKGAYGEFKAYRCAMPTLICENDKVYVTGKISKYQKSESEASIEIAKGQGGFIEISTAIQQVAEAAEQTGATKLIMGGQLYIMKHGVLYNALGVKVQ